MEAWTLTLRCRDCRTFIHFKNERPSWQDDPEAVAKLEAARAWVEENPETEQRGFALRAPEYVEYPMGQVSRRGLVRPYVLKVDPRYVACPACDGRAYLARAERAMNEYAAYRGTPPPRAPRSAG